MPKTVLLKKAIFDPKQSFAVPKISLEPKESDDCGYDNNNPLDPKSFAFPEFHVTCKVIDFTFTSEHSSFLLKGIGLLLSLKRDVLVHSEALQFFSALAVSLQGIDQRQMIKSSGYEP